VTKSIEGALAGFLVRIADKFTFQLSSEAAFRDAIGGLGIDGADANGAWAFVSANGPSITSLKSSLPALTAQLQSSSPNLAALVRPVTDLWKVVSGLAAGAPAVDLPNLPDAGSVLDLLLGSAIDATLRDLNAPTWAFARAIHLVGPELPVIDALAEFLDAPTGFLGQRFKAVRQNVDITIAGLLTGPRTTSIVTTSAEADRQIAPEVRATFPNAEVVIGRVIIRLAADTFDDPVSITFEVLGDAADPPGFVAIILRTPPWTAPVKFSDHVGLDLDPLTKPLNIALTGFGKSVPLGGDQPGLTLNSAFQAGGLSLGNAGGLRISLAEPVLGIAFGATTWNGRFGAGKFEVVIPADVAGPVLAILLPRDGITLRGKLIAVIDSDGMHLEGGIGLSAAWPDTIRLPGLVMRDLKTEIRGGGDFGLSAYGTIVVSLGPVTVSIEGLGLNQRFKLTPNGTGNVGIVDLLPPELHTPSGFGVSVDAAILKGTGFLRLQGDEISGALELALTLGALQLTVRAVAVLGNVDGAVSFLVVLSLEFSPAIEIFLGLTLNAVGGIFGLNRTLDPPGLTDVVRSGRIQDIMFPRDLDSRAAEIIASVKHVFPPRKDQFVVGPMLQLGWGRPVSFVTISVGVVFTFPKPVIVAIIGELHLALPTDDLALIELNFGFAGGINFDTGDVWFDASLERSRIGFFDVSGDVCLRAGSQGFVFSAGGFHPKFLPPAGIGAVKRLAISICPSSILEIRAEAYFAVTSSTLQFGARLFVSAELGPIGARGNLGLDVLFQTEPKFHFIAEISGSFALTVFGEEICGIDLDILLEGPGRWHARAHASIRLLFIKVSGTLDLAWGEDAIEPRSPVDVAAKVRAAITEDHVWAHVVPAADGGLVQLRSGAVGLHPLGSLRLTQTVAPIGVALQKYGANPVTSPDPVTMTVSAPGIGEPVAQTELFAPAQFFNMTDDERLSKPSFTPYPAGYTVAGSSWLPLANPITVDIVYEESTSEGRDIVGQRLYAALDAGMLSWSNTGAAGRKNAARIDPVPTRGIRVEEPSYAKANAATGAVLSAFGATDALRASMVHSADTVMVAGYEMAGVI
jgi:hypothetical protein